MWNPSNLNLKQVTVNGASTVTNGDKERTVTVEGAGFKKGLTLAFVQNAGDPEAIIPVNSVTLDSDDGSHILTGKIAPVLKKVGEYALVVWAPPLGENPQGFAPTVNDVATLANALSVASR